MDQDPSLELLQSGSGSETELVREQGADPLVGRQRIGLASRPVQRGDQQLPQTFLIGIRRHRGLQLADQVARPSEPQARRELRLRQLHACLVEPRPVRGGPVPGAGALEEIAAVPLQRRRAQVGGAAIIAGVEQFGGGGGVAQHGERVDLGRLDGERVPAVTAHDHLRIPERSPELGDLRLQRVAARVDRILGPHVLDEPVRAHERPGLEREAHQQLRGLAARHRHGLAVAPDLDGAQHRDLEHIESVRPAARCQRGVSASLDAGPMPPTLPEQLLHQLVVGDAAAIAAIVEASRTSDDPMILVAAALFAPDGDGLMARAGRHGGDDPRPSARGHRHRAPARRARPRRRARSRPPRRPPRQRPRRLDRRRKPPSQRQPSGAEHAQSLADELTIRVRPARARRGRHTASRADARRVGRDRRRVARTDRDAAGLGVDVGLEPDQSSGLGRGAGAHRRAASESRVGRRVHRRAVRGPRRIGCRLRGARARAGGGHPPQRRGAADLQLPGSGRQDPRVGRPPRHRAAGRPRRAEGRADRRSHLDRGARRTAARDSQRTSRAATRSTATSRSSPRAT